MMEYITDLMKRIFMDTPKEQRERSDYRLPVVLPIVIYNGKPKWTIERSFSYYQDHFELFGSNIMDFKYTLLNVNSYDDDYLFEMQELVSIIFAMDKSINEQRLLHLINRVRKIFSKHSIDDQIDLTDWIKDVLLKKLENNKITSLSLEVLFDKEEDEPMTYAIERMLDEIEERGMEKGMEELILRMLKKGKSAEKIADETEFPINKIIKLQDRISQQK